MRRDGNSFLVLGVFLSILVGIPTTTRAQWAMADRFHGFRFHLTGKVDLGTGFQEEAQNRAHELGCFGWIQYSGEDLVGEGRCPKSRGPMFEEWLQRGSVLARVNDIDIHVYEDTKIRFHFSHFRILDIDRDTCFEEPPHQCKSNKAPPDATRKGEL